MSYVWEVNDMARKGTKYECGECGVVMVVDKACGCEPCDLICCGVPMKKVEPKTKPKAKSKAKK